MAQKTLVKPSTGRRKKCVARVRLFPGKGEILVNGRPLAEYLQRDTLVLQAKRPLTVTERPVLFEHAEQGGMVKAFPVGSSVEVIV